VTPIADRVTELFELLAAAPEGLNKPQIGFMMKLGIDRVEQVIYALRHELGAGDTINVTCDPDPDDPQGPYIYKLTGTLDEARSWLGNRGQHIEAEMATWLAVTTSLLAGADRRTREGKRLATIERNLTFMLAQLADLSEDA